MTRASSEPELMERSLAGHAAARALRSAGVEWVAGVAGESFLPLLDGLRREQLPFLPVAQESGATFLASAYGRMSGRVAVAAVTRGPGASNALIGIHEAAQAASPVVLIIGQLESSIRGRGALQEMEFDRVFGSVAKAVFEVTRPEQLAPSLLAAVRKAELGRRGPVVVSVPADHFFAPDGGTTQPGLPVSRAAGAMLAGEDASELAMLIDGAERGLIIVGAAFGGGQHAELLGRFARRTGFGVLGGHAFPDALHAGHPSWLGPSTIRGPETIRRALGEADVIVLLDHWLGDRVTQGYLPLRARIAAIMADVEVGWDEYLEASLYTAAPARALAQLDALLVPDPDRAARRGAWVVRLRAELDAARETMLAASTRRTPAGAIPFAAIVRELDHALPRHATLVSDAGSFNDWFMRYLPFPDGRRYLGTLSGSMGFGVPGAIGAQLARPDARTVALCGDGGFLMTGMELATLGRLGLPVTVVVFRNGVWGSIALHQDRYFAGHRFAIELPQVSFADLARSLGVEARRVEDAAGLGPAFAWAFGRSGPTLIEIPTDPERTSPSSYDASDL